MATRIIHGITDLSTGGSQKALVGLLTRLDRGRFEPAVACLKNGGTPLAGELRSAGIPVFDLSFTGRRRISGFVRFYALLETLRPAILHAWLFHAVLVSRIAARMAGVPIVISARRNVNLGSPLRERVNRLTAALDDRVIAVSEAARRVEILRGGVPPEKTVVIPNGVDPLAFGRPTPQAAERVRGSLGLPPQSILIGYVGRLHPSKGVDDLLRAFASVVRRFPRARLLLAGEGEERWRLEQLSSETGLAGAVFFLGDRRDVPFLLQGLDVFVMPSREEGMPNAVIEAMAAGLPIVATSAGGTQELIEHGCSGLLVTPGDVAGIAESIISLVADRERASTLACEARARASVSYSIGATVRRTEALYEELLREKFGRT
jgi:glycosyltransferase involved in cell wall biosynthesis